MADNVKWYVVHTYSGYENAVADAIMKSAENRGMQDLIREVNVPLETVTEITDGVEKTVERKVFPGYVLVKMCLTDESWHLVRNVRGATGFVGNGNKAIPLTSAEVRAMGVEKHDVHVDLEVGCQVRVQDGPLEGFSGVVEQIDMERRMVSVKISMFGRDTPVEIEMEQLERVKT